jgi:hypothetical protein
MPRGYGSFQIIDKINDNTYKINLPDDYRVNVTFNISYLSLFDVDDKSSSN